MLVLFATWLHIYTRLLEVFPWADYSESASLKLMSLLDLGSMMNCQVVAFTKVREHQMEGAKYSHWDQIYQRISN